MYLERSNSLIGLRTGSGNDLNREQLSASFLWSRVHVYPHSTKLAQNFCPALYTTRSMPLNTLKKKTFCLDFRRQGHDPDDPLSLCI